ncbi:MAG TPA: hypothetical protein VNI77_05440, partial [Nitrososphaera sp.]|nr:hypothetical protein [Nitrososphaera sp.]
MDTKQPLSLFLAAVLVASVFTMVGIASMPVKNASAQAVSIRTSADNLGGTFYGESFLQVIVTDPDADDDDTQETISVTVTVDPESGASGSKTFDVWETSDSSGRFEFFLIHEDSDNINEGDLDPINNNPIGFSTNGASVVVFGPDGTADAIAEDAAITADVTLGAEDASIEIEVDGEEVTIDYEQMAGTLEIDRETPYGSTSIVRVFIFDQDANNDPTNVDAFTVVAADLDGTTFDDLFDLQGGTFPDD